MKRAFKLFNRYSKYRAVRTEVDGITFASKAEASLYQYLKLTGQESIEIGPKVYLTDAKILFKPDFRCGAVYYEMKGMETPSYKLKKRLWQHYGPTALYIYKMKNGKPFHDETIIPFELCDE